MSFHALLAARAHQDGRAQLTALVRHRALIADPLCIVAWQLGGEPYSVGAIALGKQSSGYRLFVPGYPLDRHLLLASLTEFANEFCPAFESCLHGPTDCVKHMGSDLAVPRQLPQIIVPNASTAVLLGRLGRRLAYQPTTGPHAAAPVLPRLGRHLMWLIEHAQLPGQQLLVSLTDLLAQHYITGMSSLEMQSLAAFDAWIEPQVGDDGFRAAEIAERDAVGPAPSPDDAQTIHALMQTLNARRAGSKDPKVVQPLATPLRAVYDRMVRQTWSLAWKVVDRERTRPEARLVARRALDDRIAYAAHMQWMAGPAEGRRKTRMTARNAALRLHELECARTLLIAEEAIDDPLRMAPHLLAGKGVAGRVVLVDAKRRERIGKLNCLRPSVTVRVEDRCIIPCGTELWWTAMPDGREWLVTSVAAGPDGTTDVTLVLQTNRVQSAGLPAAGARVCFSQFNTLPGFELQLPPSVPWTHSSKTPSTEPSNIDLADDTNAQVA